MAGEWTTFGNVVVESRGGTSIKTSEYTSGGTPVLTKGDVKPSGRVEHGGKFVNTEFAKANGWRFSQPGDLIVTTRDLTLAANFLGLVSRIPEHDSFVVNQGATIFRIDESRIDPRYLIYWCSGSEYRQHIQDNYVGSTQIHIRQDDLFGAPLKLVPLSQQKAIAAVLGALDDKIELNRRMNATLEAMARALFQSWFVDFDPVRANLDSTRVVGVEKSSAVLFPTHLEGSPLGKVPVGWRVLKFADVLTPHSSRVGEDSVPEFSATVTGLSSRDERFKKQLSKSQSKNKRIVEGELVFGFSREVINFGLMREPVGAVSPVYEVFKIDSSKIEPELLERLFRFNMPYYMDILKPGAREGKPIDRNYLLRKHLLVPDIGVQRAFLSTIQPWSDKIKANESESRTLATLRDTLLPKLLSGELSVANCL